jgi:hypothetical protein
MKQVIKFRMERGDRTRSNEARFRSMEYQQLRREKRERMEAK